jgi:peroxiredoxin (alkyl hydroperoxide reductase subunit C)
MENECLGCYHATVTNSSMHDIKDIDFLDTVKIGHPIPNFEFEAYQNNDSKRVHLHDFKGKWLILFFYPADFTFVCPTELEELAAAYPKLQELNAEVISMSTDTVFTHKAWQDTSEAIKKIKFPMGADPSGKISRAFGVYIDDGGENFVPDEGQSLRGSFIIDRDGNLKAMEINHNDLGRSAKELIRKLQAAQFVETHGGQVCPASWEPGDDTLTPGMDLVGKI